MWRADPRRAGLALVLGLLFTASASAAPEGTTLPSPPAILPGGPPPPDKSPLRTANLRYNEGDHQGAVAALTPWLESRRGPWGRERVAGHLLLATAHKELENWNLASRHFYRVRRSDGPLASHGAWHEAEVDHSRGRHLVAARECKQYRENWPAGPHADECLLLMGDAYAAVGHRSSAIDAYTRYLERHPATPRKEEIQLGIALAWAQTNPTRGIQLLHELALSHAYPSTDLAVLAELGRLAAEGHTTALPLPYDATSRIRRCSSLRRSGRFTEAWAMFEDLKALATDDPQVAEWIEQNEESYAWGTRRYDVYAASMIAQYETRPDAGVAWQVFRAWGRAGDWEKALEWGRIGLDKHRSDWRWRGAKDDMAWAALLGGEYADAAERWSALAKRGGTTGRKARFYAGLSHHEAGQHDEAIETFDALLKYPREWRAAAHYWRAKSRARAGDTDGAAADRSAAIEHDESGWYTALLSSGESIPQHGWLERDGRWHGSGPAEAPQGVAPTSTAFAQAGFWPSASPVSSEHGFQRTLSGRTRPSSSMNVRWDAHHDSTTTESPQDVLAPVVRPAGIALPNGYVESEFWSREQAEADFERFSQYVSAIWPNLPAANDLARAGLYTDAARLINVAYAEWRDVLKNGVQGDERRQQIADLQMTVAAWRPFLLLTRDHYHAALASSGLDRHVSDPGDTPVVRRLAYPVVRPREIWGYSQQYNVDPYLVMAIMRQESTYRNTALSPVGAIGLIQVMPRTGAKVAALLGEQRYSPRDLEDPIINLRYGVFYLSQLLDRFGGVFPMAVASYNGGPHNVSRWYKQQPDNIAMDLFTELIQYDETRDYVKKVTGHYIEYIRAYEPADARVAIPTRPGQDDASVIDF